MFTKILSKLLLICFFFLVIFFSIANSETVILGIWPLENRIEIPLFFLTIVSLTLGVFIGIFLSIYLKIKKK